MTLVPLLLAVEQHDRATIQKTDNQGRVVALDLDLNSARGILLRALVDTPWMRNHLALVS
jgi:hypothetical protein